MENKRIIFYSFVIIIGLTINAIIIGGAIKRFKKEDRFVSVKGFSEREVKSDFAVWTIQMRVANNDLSEGSKSINETKNKVISFLMKNGIDQKEIIQKDLIVNDKKAQDYDNNIGDSYRFIIDKIIQVRSTNIDRIQNVSGMTDELLNVGVILSKNYESSVKYIYTKLNEIKPLMLTEATRNAKNAAIQFAKESDTRLGNLKKANQGLFSIIDRDEFLSGQSDGSYYQASCADIYKKVRVVVSVDYSIE
ncbi:MAG: SIMPL domain-containing protein [Bacteroidota bacterium]